MCNPWEMHRLQTRLGEAKLVKKGGNFAEASWHPDRHATSTAHTTCKDCWPRHYLHKAAQAEDGVIEATLLEILLSAGLHLHERDLRVLVAVVNGKEHVSLNAHCLQNHP